MPFWLTETLVCMPLPFTPTTGFGKKARRHTHPGGDLPADQLVELNLVRRCNHFAVAVVDFELRRCHFRVILLVLEAHRALHFRGRVDERAQRVARQRVIVAAGVHVFELAGFVVAALPHPAPLNRKPSISLAAFSV